MSTIATKIKFVYCKMKKIFSEQIFFGVFGMRNRIFSGSVVSPQNISYTRTVLIGYWRLSEMLPLPHFANI